MRPNAGLSDLAARVLSTVSDYLRGVRPDLVLAQGDTTTVCATALACHYNQVPFGHVEAGLRTGRPYDPFPEEGNRKLADHLAELHFAPTLKNRANLRREGIAEGSIHVTGNTGIDALLHVAGRAPTLPVRPATSRFLLVTAHRRENFGAPLERICRAILDLVERHRDLSVVFPLHPNPNVRGPVAERLDGHERIQLIEPATYPGFIALMKGAFAILSDSGGTQEEAPALGKPVLVLRETTERVEALQAGTARLVGTRHEAIVAAVDELINDPAALARSSVRTSPYGDGWAAERIARVLAGRFGIDPGPWPEGICRDWPG
jgi:UDP-N-acetylglucosamine 2-epimerase (non-hydrolysing)